MALSMREKESIKLPTSSSEGRKPRSCCGDGGAPGTRASPRGVEIGSPTGRGARRDTNAAAAPATPTAATSTASQVGIAPAPAAPR